MDSSSEVKKPREVARISLRATFFAIAGIFLVAILIFFGLRWIVTNPAISPELKMSILFGAAFVSLILGFSAITLSVRRLRIAEARDFSIWQVFILAYLIPAIALFVMVFAHISNPSEKFLSNIISFFLWLSRIPFLWIIQVSVLAWLMCKSRHQEGSKHGKANLKVLMREEIQGWKKTLLSDQMVIAILFGLGSWLAARFLISIESNWLPGQLLFVSSVDTMEFAPLYWLTALFGLTLAPWAEEVFFQERLVSIFKGRISWLTGSLAAAIMFGFFQFRPLLFLPAVMLGMGCGWLRSHLGIRQAVLAHMLFNLFTLLLAWTQVI